MKEFKNRHNKAYTTEDGIIYNSRSVAILGYIFAIYNENMYVLIGERSKLMDNPNKLNMPCGYLDWDETLFDAFVREMYEETGFDIESVDETNISVKTDEPFRITTNLEAKQNVTLHYGFVFECDTLPELTHCTESNWVKWINIEDLFTNYKSEDFAFNHYERISEFVLSLAQQANEIKNKFR